MKAQETHKRNSILTVLGRTFARFNPASRPVVPAHLAIYSVAWIFTFLFFYDAIRHTFIKEYGNLALSAWVFVLLVNFLEAIGEIFGEK